MDPNKRYKNQSKRGCTQNPDDGVGVGIFESQADYNVIPSGYTNINQLTQRITSKQGNNLRATAVSIGSPMECFQCEVEMTAIKPGLNPTEPIYDMIKDQDTSSCWQVQHHVTGSNTGTFDRIQTASSGQCHGNCYVSAYKYKISNDQLTTFKWFLKRGCARNIEDPKENGSEVSKKIFGLKITNTICDYKNGTLCNDQLNGYDPSLELKTQIIEPIQCYTCQTSENNTDPYDECYTIPSQQKPVKEDFQIDVD